MSGEHSTKSFSGRTQTAENLSKLIGTVTDKVKELASSGSVAGDKIYFEDSAVIPVSKVSAGFAGGAADILNFDKRSADGGAGAGAKITVTPMAFIVREDALWVCPSPSKTRGRPRESFPLLSERAWRLLRRKRPKRTKKPIVRSPSPKPKATAKPAEESLKNPPKQKRNSYSDGGPKNCGYKGFYTAVLSPCGV